MSGQYQFEVACGMEDLPAHLKSLPDHQLHDLHWYCRNAERGVKALMHAVTTIELAERKAKEIEEAKKQKKKVSSEQ